jgi:hypothetical protein
MSQAEGQLLPNFEKYEGGGGGKGKTIPPHLFFGKNLRKTEFLSLKQKQKNIVQLYALKPNDLFFYFKVL